MVGTHVFFRHEWERLMVRVEFDLVHITKPTIAYQDILNERELSPLMQLPMQDALGENRRNKFPLGLVEIVSNLRNRIRQRLYRKWELGIQRRMRELVVFYEIHYPSLLSFKQN